MTVLRAACFANPLSLVPVGFQKKLSLMTQAILPYWGWWPWKTVDCLGHSTQRCRHRQPIRNLFPWSANWDFQDAAVAENTAPGGGPSVAILATRKSDDLMGVELRNPDDNTRIRIVYPLGFGWSPSGHGHTYPPTANTALAVLAIRDRGPAHHCSGTQRRRLAP